MRNIQSAFPSESVKFPDIRQKHITASVLSALFGENDYTTHWQLWRDIKHGKRINASSTAAMLGTIMEPAIAHAFEALEGCVLEKVHAYQYDPELRFGASLDFVCYKAGDDEYVDGIPFDTKMVNLHAWSTKWKKGAAVPAAYVFQMLGQMHITSTKQSLLGVMVAGSELHLIPVQWSDALWNECVTRIADFWVSIAEGREPMPDERQDADEILRVYRRVDAVKTYDGTNDNHLNELAIQYADLTAQSSELGKRMRAVEKERNIAKAGIYAKIKDAAHVALRNGAIITTEGARKGYVVADSITRSIKVEI